MQMDTHAHAQHCHFESAGFSVIANVISLACSAPDPLLSVTF